VAIAFTFARAYKTPADDNTTTVTDATSSKRNAPRTPRFWRDRDVTAIER
jgi:hypothetical protein